MVDEIDNRTEQKSTKEEYKVDEATAQAANGVKEPSAAIRDECSERENKTKAAKKAAKAKENKADTTEDEKSVETLQNIVATLEEEKKEQLQSFLRLRADFDNYKRRTRQEILQAADQGKEELLAELLPVLDNLELALDTTGEPEKWRSGVEMIFRQFLEILRQAGLKPIPSVGEIFDPNIHEAIMREPSMEPENTVLEELKRGYLFGEKTLRPSMVKVAAFDPDLASENEKE